MQDTLISKPIYRVLVNLTQEPRLEVALPLAVKDWIRLKLDEVRREREAFELQYGMSFQAFRESWEQGQVADRFSHQVERDYWLWEAAVSDEARLQDLQDSLP